MNCLLIFAVAAGLLSDVYAQYAFTPHDIIPDRNVYLGFKKVLVYNYSHKGSNLYYEWNRQPDRFEFRGTNYSYNCFPIFREFNQKLPSYAHCNHYYQLVAADSGGRHVVFNQCGENEKFDVYLSRCVRDLPYDCVRSTNRCLAEPSLSYMHHIYDSLDENNRYMWLIPVNIDEDIQWFNEHINFFYKGYHYWHSCFPIFFTKTSGNMIPDPLSCNRYYRFEEHGDNYNVINLVSCGRGRMFNDDLKTCVYVDVLPYGCTKRISSCDRPLSQVYGMNLLPSYDRRSSNLLYEVTDVFVDYLFGSYLYNRNLYDVKCVPLIMNNPSMLVQDPTNCHYYYALDEQYKVRRYECSSVDEFFNQEANSCQSHDFPENCHPEGGCNTDMMSRFNITSDEVNL